MHSAAQHARAGALKNAHLRQSLTSSATSDSFFFSPSPPALGLASTLSLGICAHVKRFLASKDSLHRKIQTAAPQPRRAASCSVGGRLLSCSRVSVQGSWAGLRCTGSPSARPGMKLTTHECTRLNP